MAEPQTRQTYTLNGETREWDGTHWVPLGTSTTDAPMFPAVNLPPNTPARGAPAGAAELWKQILTIGGGIGGGVLAGPPGAILGASLGRTAGALPEHLVRNPDAEPFLDAAAKGGIEGGVNEMLPAFAGRIAKGTGTLLKGTGRVLGDNPAWSPWLRARIASMRGAGAGYIAGPAAGGVASVGPIAASEAGSALESAGAKMGTETLSERVSGAWKALMDRLDAPPVVSRAERLAAGAEDYAGQQVADAAQEAAARKASGLSGIRDPVPPLDITAAPTSGTGVAEGTATAQTPQAQEWFSGARKGSIEPDYSARPPITVRSSPSTDALLQRATPDLVRTRPAADAYNAVAQPSEHFLETPRWVGETGVEIRDAFNKLKEKLWGNPW